VGKLVHGLVCEFTELWPLHSVTSGIGFILTGVAYCILNWSIMLENH